MAGMTNTIPADAALELLKSGNARYVADVARRPRSTPRRRGETSGGQWPFAVVLTCADSRVGHQACGAVGAAIDPPADAPTELADLVGVIKAAVGAERKIDRAVVKNARAAAKGLKATLKGPSLKHGKVVAATYSLQSGEVTWL